mmetsp:Transcript_139923/g.390041  ORF Transcript_139923/g.390041 Transcript_139923/m.390041 type:complete len:284 (+) Transcript_139923:1227-2078(+)
MAAQAIALTPCPDWTTVQAPVPLRAPRAWTTRPSRPLAASPRARARSRLEGRTGAPAPAWCRRRRWRSRRSRRAAGPSRPRERPCWTRGCSISAATSWQTDSGASRRCAPTLSAPWRSSVIFTGFLTNCVRSAMLQKQGPARRRQISRFSTKRSIARCSGLPKSSEGCMKTLSCSTSSAGGALFRGATTPAPRRRMQWGAACLIMRLARVAREQSHRRPSHRLQHHLLLPHLTLQGLRRRPSSCRSYPSTCCRRSTRLSQRTGRLPCRHPAPPPAAPIRAPPA